MTMEEKKESLRRYREAGESHICPTKAAPILGCMPYSLNVAAKSGRLPASAYYFAGRNLRISVSWLMKQCGVNAKSPRRRCSVESGADHKNHTQYTTTAKEAQVPC